MKGRIQRGKNQPGVERHVVSLTGPDAFKINPKKPQGDERPHRLVGKKSVDSERGTHKAIRKRLDGKRI